MTHFLTPTGMTCPLTPGQFCEIHWADGSVFRGRFFHGVMTGAPGFVQGQTGWMGGKRLTSWDWSRRGDCVPVRRYRVIGDEAMETLRQAAKNPVRAGNPGACDLPHRVATRGTSPALEGVGGFSH
jgi:hypothetical protein